MTHKKYYSLRCTVLLLVFFSNFTNAQTTISGTVVDAKTNTAIEGASVVMLPSKASAISDASGRFFFKQHKTRETIFIITTVGYAPDTVTIQLLIDNKNIIPLVPRTISLKDISISAHAGEQYKAISKADIVMRGVNNSQEVLRIIPGMVIGQHQGGGKAEQIFLRGFDADHGTDFRMDVDGLPINMVSHAHGQGFADGHFIIPETIDNVDFKKGPYTASKGDFATTGFADFNTRNLLKKNMAKMEAGQFNTYRLMGMFNLLNEKARKQQQSWYVAGEYRYSDAFFDNPQHFKRFNLFTKYSGKISKRSNLSFSATTFWSKWNASGQIPDRAVDNHLIGFYGAIDPFEGGITYRTNFNAQLVTALKNGDIIKNQLYYSRSHFDLHTNFTFFLEDSVNGDQIRQKESRNLMGYNGSYIHSLYSGNTVLNTELGLQVRNDIVSNAELSHTKDRYTTLNRIKLGDISQLSIAPYLSETFKFNEHFSINAGLRFDQFFHQYKNKLAADTTLPAIGTYKANAHTLSPKLNFYYHINDRLQFYLTTGKGFHSNDTRSVVVGKGNLSLPPAYSADLGTVFKPAKNIIINAAVWYIYLQQEFVYSGDGGFVEFSGKTRRLGVDFSGRFEPVKSLYFDVDVNYAHGRTAGAQKGADYIPLAPVWTSSGGITYNSKKGLNGSFRYRFVGNRSANEDNSRKATGYFITDAVINYTHPKYEIGLVVNNVFNTKWKETQFDTETRLKGEIQPVNEVCFTPGTPLALKTSFTYFF